MKPALALLLAVVAVVGCELISLDTDLPFVDVEIPFPSDLDVGDAEGAIWMELAFSAIGASEAQETKEFTLEGDREANLFRGTLTDVKAGKYEADATILFAPSSSSVQTGSAKQDQDVDLVLDTQKLSITIPGKDGSIKATLEAVNPGLKGFTKLCLLSASEPVCLEKKSSDVEHKANSEPSQFNLQPGAAGGFYAKVSDGKKYFLLASAVTNSSGPFDAYVAASSVYNPLHCLGGSSSPCKVEFSAGKEGERLITTRASKTAAASVAVGLYSYETNLDPLSGATRLTVNGGPINSKGPKNSAGRLYFAVQADTGYTVKVKSVSGAVDVYLSKIPAVGAQVNEQSASLAGSGAEATISYRPDYSGNAHLAVVDRGNANGSEISITITSP